MRHKEIHPVGYSDAIVPCISKSPRHQTKGSISCYYKSRIWLYPKLAPSPLIRNFNQFHNSQDLLRKRGNNAHIIQERTHVYHTRVTKHRKPRDLDYQVKPVWDAFNPPTQRLMQSGSNNRRSLRSVNNHIKILYKTKHVNGVWNNHCRNVTR